MENELLNSLHNYIYMALWSSLIALGLSLAVGFITLHIKAMLSKMTKSIDVIRAEVKDKDGFAQQQNIVLIKMEQNINDVKAIMDKLSDDVKEMKVVIKRIGPELIEIRPLDDDYEQHRRR